MVTVTLTSEQVLILVQQLTPNQKRELLLVLATEAQTQRDERMLYAENRLRSLAAARGLSWDELDEDAREEFVDNLLHEQP
jgi:hypothetical protein